MSVRRDDPRALIRYALAATAVAVVIAWALYVARDALLIIYLSAIVAIGLSPIVHAIERRGPAAAGGRRRVPRWLAILVIYVLFLGGLVGLGILIMPPLISQARELWERVPELVHRGQLLLMRIGILDQARSVGEAVRSVPVPGGDALGTVFGAVWGVVGGVFGLVTILILAFYMLVDAENIVRTFVRLFPAAERQRVDAACRRVSTKVSAWLAGQLLLAAIIGATAAAGLFLLGVPYFYVLALIAGVGEMIPIVGPIISAIPAIAVALSVSPALALGVVIFFFLQQQLENHVLVPKIMERQVGVSAMVVIVALLIGGSLLGVLGAILAVPSAAILQVVFEELGPDAAASDAG